MNKIKTFDERKQVLVEKGKEKGYMTYEEMAHFLSGLKLDSNSIDELYDSLNENKIAIVSEIDENIDETNMSDEVKTNSCNVNDSMYIYLKEKIITAIKSWNEEGIYAVSLFVYDEEDNPCKPTVTLGYNTELNVMKNISSASSEEEARWNFAFGLQHEEFCFGIDDTEEMVKNWIIEKGLPYFENVGFGDEKYDELTIITKEFVNVLVVIVQDIHKLGILKKKFGKEIPIIIHELEYYKEIALQNIEANGRELVEDFVNFCNPITYVKDGKLMRAYDI